jgi:hypothetical protein
VFYSLYLNYFFKSDEYSASTNSWSITTYNAITQQIVKDQPYARFGGWVEDFDENCQLAGYRNVYAVNATDASIFPSIGHEVETNGIVFVKIELIVNWAQRQLGILNTWENTIIECFRMIRFDDGVGYSEMVDGYVPGAFVSKDGGLPGSLGRAAAIASGIFWAGILHCYTVDAIPMVTVKVVKNGAMVGETPSCSQWPGVTCWPI